MQQYTYDYPRPAVTVDLAVFQCCQPALQVLLIERAKEPFVGRWALPGGFIGIDEPLEAAARRELQEETGLSDLALRQFGVFGRPGRDPRGRTISVGYLAIIPGPRTVELHAGDDAGRAGWFEVQSLPSLAFDHQEIVQAARDRLGREVLYRGLAFDLLEDTFRVAQMLAVYEALLGRSVDAEALLKGLLALNVVEEIGGQPEATYRLDRPRLRHLLDEDRLAPLGDAGIL